MCATGCICVCVYAYVRLCMYMYIYIHTYIREFDVNVISGLLCLVIDGI
jgi:hypothetical protein